MSIWAVAFGFGMFVAGVVLTLIAFFAYTALVVFDHCMQDHKTMKVRAENAEDYNRRLTT
jgi:hypothetical protein